TTRVPRESHTTAAGTFSDPSEGPRVYDMESLRHRTVEVWAAGFRYRGTFVGADEQELYLRGETRWWVIRMEHVSDLKVIADAPLEERPLARTGPIPGLDGTCSAIEPDEVPSAPPEDEE
ncbi:MAG: hypothetical protein ACO3JL_18575, partial [Myxococcota bacterium]